MEQKSEGQDEKQPEQDEGDERVIKSIPKVIYEGGSCKHHYTDYDLDDEGYMNARCIKCPMGIRYKPEESELKDGRLITR